MFEHLSSVELDLTLAEREFEGVLEVPAFQRKESLRHTAALLTAVRECELSVDKAKKKVAQFN